MSSSVTPERKTDPVGEGKLRLRHRLSAWVPVLICILVIATESTTFFGADHTSGPLQRFCRVLFRPVHGPAMVADSYDHPQNWSFPRIWNSFHFVVSRLLDDVPARGRPLQGGWVWHNAVGNERNPARGFERRAASVISAESKWVDRGCNDRLFGRLIDAGVVIWTQMP